MIETADATDVESEPVYEEGPVTEPEDMSQEEVVEKPASTRRKRGRPRKEREKTTSTEEEMAEQVRVAAANVRAIVANGNVIDSETGLVLTELSHPNITSKVGLLLPAGIPIEQWATVGVELKRINESVQWWMGDWFRYGDAEFGQMASQMHDAVGLDLNTLGNYSWVAGSIPLEKRRVELDWSHHAEVAGVTDPKVRDALLQEAIDEHLTVKQLRARVKGPRQLAAPGSRAASTEHLLRFCPPSMSSADIVAALLRVHFPDAQNALDTTYGNGGFWNGSAHVDVTGWDIDPARGLDGVCDFTKLQADDEEYDVVAFDPPQLEDGGLDGIMADRFGTNPDLRPLIMEGVAEAWRVARIGIIVKVTDHVHGQTYQSETDWVRWALTPPDFDPTVPYDVVYQTREHAVIDPKWGEQASAYNNGSTYLIFRKGSQEHVRR